MRRIDQDMACVAAQFLEEKPRPKNCAPGPASRRSLHNRPPPTLLLVARSNTSDPIRSASPTPG